MDLLLLFVGQTILGQTPLTGASPNVMGLFPIALMLGLVVFLLLSARRRKKCEQRQKEETYSCMTKNDRVLPIGGIIGAIIRLFGFLEIVLAMLLGFFALFGFFMGDDTFGRVVAGVFVGLALLLAMFGVRNMRHRGPRDLTLPPQADSPSDRPRTDLRYDVVGGTFARESDLENYLVRNWDRLDFGTPLQFVAQQVPCAELGIIDVLARDRVTRDYVVVELKKEQADDVVFGQLARYMGGIERDRATMEGVGVRGIIVARTTSSRLRAAASVNPKVGLRQYVWVPNGESRASLAQRLNCSPGDLLLLPATGEQLGCMCGHENAANARYCAGCGSRISRP